LVKSFSLDAKRIETRLLFRSDEQSWIGASYEWNDEGSDATLLEDEKRKVVTTEPAWHYPSRSQCFQCHTRGAGISLGPSTQQLDFELEYAEGRMNQLDKLIALGWLEGRPKALPKYPTPTQAGEVAPRARAYLQANCSMCHRPGGTISDVDLRFSTPLSAMGLCNQNIERGTGDPLLPQKRLVPGHPELSSLSFRVRDLGMYRMPKIGSSRLDPDGAQLLDDWISSLTACP
jgi:mono/diheme cytochrome c family protein